MPLGSHLLSPGNFSPQFPTTSLDYLKLFFDQASLGWEVGASGESTMLRPGTGSFLLLSDSSLHVRLSSAREAGDFSGAALIASVLDSTRTGARSGVPGPLAESLASGRARTLSQAIEQLNPAERTALRQRWGRSLAELISLSNERDRPALALPVAQSLIDLLISFGWRESRQNPRPVFKIRGDPRPRAHSRR